VPFREFGIYVFKFFKNYKWRWVIVDELLPCEIDCDNPQISPKLAFAFCDNENEFWAPLVEKAYAKLHKNYQALNSGYIDDGLSDMTGLTCEKLKVQLTKKNPTIKDKNTHEQLMMNKLLELQKNKSMMGTSITGVTEQMLKIDNKDCGLLANHAYGVLDLFEIKTKDLIECRNDFATSFNLKTDWTLMRIRNPWGSSNCVEWNGQWSDNSIELTDNL